MTDMTSTATPPVQFLLDCANTRTDRCIEWPWSLGSTGYPQVRYDGTTRKAHQAVLVMSGRPQPAPPSNYALHSCDNPPCVNPRHLRWGTHQDNVEDAVARDRIRPTRARGERAGSARLTDEVVRQIRQVASTGLGQRATARHLGLARSTVQAVLTGQHWGHVDG